MATTEMKLTLQQVSTESDPIRVPVLTNVSFDGPQMQFSKMIIELPPGAKLYSIDGPPTEHTVEIPGISKPPSSPK